MIKELLEQLAPLDAQIAALRGGAQDEESQMAAITAHASELAELAVEEDEILRCCGPLTAEDRVFLARHPERPHIDETINAPFTDEEISAKMVELLTPKGTKAKVEIVYQPLEGLHEACPHHKGDWYFSGNYPTPGGVKMVNRAFIDYIEQMYQF